MDDTITQIYFDMVGDHYTPELVVLIKSMLNHGYDLEECFDLTQHQKSYKSMFLELPMNSKTLEFFVWLSPHVSLYNIQEKLWNCSIYTEEELWNLGIDVVEECTVDVWRPILETKSNEIRQLYNIFDRTIISLIKGENYEIPNLLLELGVKITHIFTYLSGLDSTGAEIVRQVEYLLNRGAHPNILVKKWSTDFTPIHHFMDRVDMVQLLLNHEADPNRFCKTSVSPLSEAMRGQHFETVRLLMAQSTILLTPEANGCSLMPHCIWPEFWPRLLEAGNGINDQAGNGTTLLYNLVDKQVSLDILEEFLKLEPDLELRPHKINFTVLYMACENKWLDTAKLLLRYGADPNQLCTFFYQTPKSILSTDHPRYNELFNHNSVKRAE